MSGDSAGPPPGFGHEDLGSHEPPADPPPPSFPSEERRASSDDRPAGGPDDVPSANRQHGRDEADAWGRSEQYDSTRHEWNDGAGAGQSYDPTRHEWNQGDGASKPWGDGRPHHEDRQDHVSAPASCGRRTSWETSTTSTTKARWSRRQLGDDPWTASGDPWQRQWRTGGEREAYERGPQGRDSVGFRGSPWADGRDMAFTGSDSGDRRGQP